MTPKQVRFTGLTAVLGGLIFPILNGIEDVFYPQITDATGTTAFVVYYLVVTAAAVCLLGGLVGLYAYARREFGYFGIGGTVLAGVGYASIAVAGIVIILTNESGQGSTGQLFGAIGYLSTFFSAAILGIALWRADVELRLSGGLFVLSFLVFAGELAVWDPVLFYYPFGIGWILVGHELWSASKLH
jgi:hypothetical protein